RTPGPEGRASPAVVVTPGRNVEGSSGLPLDQRGGVADGLRVPGAHRGDEFWQGHAERMGDAVERRDPGGDARGLDLDDRLAVDARGLGETVDRPPTVLALAGNLDAERAEVRSGSRHTFQRAPGAYFAQSPKRAYSR